MSQFVSVETFDDWREAARRLLQNSVPPSAIHWSISEPQALLFEDTDLGKATGTRGSTFTVPKPFVEIARKVACHRDPSRWETLYRTLWRLTHGERDLLQRITDDDIRTLDRMRRQVSRDVHKMKAFVRFRKVEDESSRTTYVAWHQPDHRIVRLTAPFFARRFQSMNWTILTPKESVSWDQSSLTFGQGVPVSEAPSQDQLEDLWRTYYRSIFNPARVKISAMKREMPVRHWATLPETTEIDDLLRQAPMRLETFARHSEGFHQTAMDFMPTSLEIDELREASKSCKACSLHQSATQTVFGVGSTNPTIMLVGEQPGDREDIVGEPFVGPAGQLLDEALAHAMIERKDIYLTNVVKHFKFVQPAAESSSSGNTSRGKRRLHQKPDSREIFACRPWLEAEIAALRPKSIVCLGATAAQALFGRDFRISTNRGKSLTTEWCGHTIATWHPAAILRMPDSTRQLQMTKQLTLDLRSAKNSPDV